MRSKIIKLGKDGRQWFYLCLRQFPRALSFVVGFGLSGLIAGSRERVCTDC